jgi:REP element-mobilizing transposase RayT
MTETAWQAVLLSTTFKRTKMNESSDWNREPPPSFQGLRDDLPLTCYARHLPHWRQAGATYFVTFRLADSLPQEKLRELESLRTEWRKGERDAEPALLAASAHSNATRSDLNSLAREIIERVERWLDQGYGECWLKRNDVARMAAEAMQHFDQQEYELGCYVVMPNHVHAIIRPFSADDEALSKVLHSRKLWMASSINKLVGREGAVWQDESFDRIIRDEEHLYRCIQYIGRNPKFAGLHPAVCQLWIQPTWRELGWDFE